MVDTGNNDNLAIYHKGLCVDETLPVTLISARRFEEKFKINYFQGIKYKVRVGEGKLIFAYNYRLGFYIYTLEELMGAL